MNQRVQIAFANPEGNIVKREQIDRKVFTVGEDALARPVELVKWRTIREGWTVRGSDLVTLFPSGRLGKDEPCAVSKDDPGLHALLAFLIANSTFPEELKNSMRGMIAETMR